MKKLHSLAFYAMVAPAITLGSGAVLADRSTGVDDDRGQEGAQTERSDRESRPGATTRDQGSQRTDGAETMSTTDRQDHDREGKDYMSAAPSGGTQASDLIGANVTTTAGEEVGSVDDLIIDEEGQVVAITVGVGGFLGMGQKDVAIGWDQVTKSGDADDLELQVDTSRDDLRNAPAFERHDD